MAFFDDQADPYAALGTTVSHPRRPAPPPQAPPRPAGQFSIDAAPPMATPQAPSQDAASRGSAASGFANAGRTTALTPLEVQAQDLQNRLRQLELERQGRTADQQYTREQNIADLNSMGERLQRVGNLYNQNFREQDPWFSFGLSDNEHQFDSAANMLRQQAQGAFRNIGSGTVSDYDAQLLERRHIDALEPLGRRHADGLHLAGLDVLLELAVAAAADRDVAAEDGRHRLAAGPSSRAWAHSPAARCWQRRSP